MGIAKPGCLRSESYLSLVRGDARLLALAQVIPRVLHAPVTAAKVAAVVAALCRGEARHVLCVLSPRQEDTAQIFQIPEPGSRPNLPGIDVVRVEGAPDDQLHLVLRMDCCLYHLYRVAVRWPADAGGQAGT